MRIALISDTHVSVRSPECVANWHAARRAVERLRPDLTVHLGDISLDGQSRPEDLDYAAGLVRRWPGEMRCVPGNHDLGDGSGEAPLDEALLANYRHLFAADRWRVALDGWQLLGINAQLMGTGSRQEQAQWEWIETIAAATGSALHTALFLHRPLARLRPDDPKTTGRYVTAAARERLLGGPLRPSLRLVVSGHTHQYLDDVAVDVRHIWMPSSGFVLPDAMQARVGEKVVGIGTLELSPKAMHFDLWCPDGMIRHDLSNMPVFNTLGATERPATHDPGRAR